MDEMRTMRNKSKSPDSICCQLLITRLEHHPDRMKVILVNDDLGF